MIYLIFFYQDGYPHIIIIMHSVDSHMGDKAQLVC